MNGSPSQAPNGEIESVTAKQRHHPIHLKANMTALHHKNPKRIWFVGGATTLVLATVLTGSAIWFSPTWTPSQIVNAARAGDQTKLEQLVDFQAVRSSLETDLKDAMGAAFRKEVASANDQFTMLFSGLGAGILDATATSIADQIVNTRAVEKVANGQEIRVDVMGSPRDIQFDLNSPVKGRYLSTSRYEYEFRPNASGVPLYVQMQRTGPFSWRVDRLRLGANWMTAALDAEPAAKVEQPQRVLATSSAAQNEDERVWALYEHDDCGDMVGPERTGCWEAEQEFQDRHLNAEYAALRARLDGPGKEGLRQLQLSWIKARDQKCYDPDFGSGAWAVAACLTAETAKRRLFLQDYQP